MEQKCNVTILASKRLTKSFTQNEARDIWQSIGLTIDEAQRVVATAFRKMNKDSEPLTITVTVNA